MQAMGEDMLNRILRHLDDAEPPPAAGPPGASTSNEGLDPVAELKISMPSWLGHKVVCSAELLEQNDTGLEICAPESFEHGQYVWIDRNGERLQCVVEECRTEGDRNTLSLSYRPDRRRATRNVVAIDGELEWLHGLSRVRVAASLTNLSNTGAQLRLNASGPEQGEVIVRYDSVTREAEVRYYMQSGNAHLVGVEFRR